MNDVLKKVELYVKEYFKKNFNDKMIYHNLNHTTEVINIVKLIGESEGLNSDDLEIILIAGWFHDLGHFDICHGHEKISSSIAKEFLEKENYPDEKIEKVIGCICATKIPQNPKNQVEKILCDADLHHLGLSGVEKRGKILREEFEKRNIKKFSDVEWLESSIKFFSEHMYFTNYAKQHFGGQKKMNLQILKDKLKKISE